MKINTNISPMIGANRNSVVKAKPNYDPVAALGGDLIAYWDANRADTFTVDQNAVRIWTDLVADYQLTQTTPNLKPMYDATAFGGRACIVFDGIQQYLTSADANLLAALPVNADPCEMWVLCSQDIAVADTTTRYVVGYADSSVVNGRGVARVVTGGINRARTYTGTGAAATIATDTHVDLFGIHVLRGICGATQTSIDVDGNDAVVASVVPVTSVPTLFRVGTIPALAATNWWQGKVAAVLITKPLTAEKVTALHNYLG